MRSSCGASGFDHDAEGNLTGLKPPGRQFHRFTLTPGGLTQAYDPPNVGGLAVDQTSYQYNLDRQLEHLYRPDGQSVDLGYESGTGRLVSVTQPRGTSSLTYVPGPGGNGAGHVQSLSSPDGVGLTFGYDGSLPTSETWDFGGGVTGSVGYAFDENFWPTSQTVQGSTGAASTLTYDFDADGLVTSATISGGPALGLTPDPTTSLLDSLRVAGMQTRYAYNPYAELTSTATWVGSDTLYAATYERDDLGRITRIVETTDGTTTDRAYTYHDRGWLIGVRDRIHDVALGSYLYDLNGNDTLAVDDRGTRSGRYDEQDRLTALGSATFRYTAAGERISRTVGSDSVTTAYDLLGNLTKVRLANGDSIEYRVDGKNRRVARLLNGTLTDRWLYGNDLAVVGELDGSGALVKRFVYASSSHVPDLMIVRNPSGPDSTYRIVTDQVGSVRLVVNTATGTVMQRMDYDAWGRATNDTRPGFTPFGYAGGLHDPATGLVRFGARDYDADAGVWCSKDPVGFATHSLNSCRFVDADPVNYFDPTGLMPVDAGARHAGPQHGYELNAIDEALASLPSIPQPVADAGAGFGDVVTFGVSKLVREIEGIQETVDDCSTAYSVGATAGWITDLALTAAAWGQSLGISAKLAVHGPHHEFGLLGKLSHVQLNMWERGVAGSGTVFRIPLPWR